MIAFSANARFGQGGQGEFLRQMAVALRGREAVIYSRHSPGPDPRAIDIPFTGANKLAFDAILRTPLLRARHDWLTVLSDTQFDYAVAERLARTSAPPPVNDPSVDHPSVDHPPVDHPPVDHPPVDHPSVDHLSVHHPSVDHLSVHHPSVDHPSPDRRSVDHPSPITHHPMLFDGVTGQCANSFDRLKQAGARLVLTSLNTHVDHLRRELAAEHERLDFRGVSFLGTQMVARIRRELALADHFRVNSEFARRTFIDHGIDESRVTAIQPSVDLERFHPVESQDDVFRVMAVSSVDPRKGIHDLLEAFESARIPQSELVIIGGTGDRWSKSLVASYIRRNGNIRLEHADVNALPVERTYGRASVFVHPAIEDGWGLVVPQALASGVPAIVSAGAGASELISDGDNGFVVPPRSPGAIRQELRLLASDATLRHAIAARARKSVLHLTQDAFTAAVHALYDGVASR